MSVLDCFEYVNTKLVRSDSLSGNALLKKNYSFNDIARRRAEILGIDREVESNINGLKEAVTTRYLAELYVMHLNDSVRPDTNLARAYYIRNRQVFTKPGSADYLQCFLFDTAPSTIARATKHLLETAGKWEKEPLKIKEAGYTISAEKGIILSKGFFQSELMGQGPLGTVIGPIAIKGMGSEMMFVVTSRKEPELMTFEAVTEICLTRERNERLERIMSRMREETDTPLDLRE